MITRGKDGITVVGMMERVDSVTARAAEEELRGVVDGVDQALLLDFSATTYICSAGLRVVLQAAKGMKAKGGRFALCSLQEFVHEMFETAGLMSALKVYESEEAARASMASSQGGAG
jgi:anti-anti-sigma factor